jgi:hypothetical protein
VTVGATSKSIVAIGTTGLLNFAGGAAGTAAGSYISTGEVSPIAAYQGGLANAAAGYLGNILFPLRNVVTAGQVPYFAPRTFAGIFRSGAGAVALRRSLFFGSAFGAAGTLIPWGPGDRTGIKSRVLGATSAV